MNKKISLDDFLTILYTAIIEAKITELSLSDISGILSVAESVPEFSGIFDCLDFSELEIEKVLDHHYVESSDESGNIKLKSNIEVDKAMDENKELSNKINDIVASYYISLIVQDGSDGEAELSFESPDSTYFYNESNDDMQGLSLYTDGDVNIKSGYLGEEFGTLVEIDNSTFLLWSFNAGSVKNISVRSKFIQGSHILGLVNRVRSGIISDYKKVCDSPKVYKLLKQ